MKVIRPTTINDLNLTSSTIAETDHAAWSSGTTYGLGAYCIKTSTHRIYQSTQAANLNHDPETAGVSWWIDIGPTNRWGMFDSKVGTVSTAATSITVVLAPGRIDSLSLLQVDAATVDVSMTSGGLSVYSTTIEMLDSAPILDWFGYFMEPISAKDSLVLLDLPAYADCVLTITLSKTAGDVSCGMCVPGVQASLGNVLASPTIGIVDYSRKTTDDFGNVTLVQRSYSKTMSVKLYLSSTEVDFIHSTLSNYRATPMVWVGSEQYTSMMIFGFYRDFSVDIAYPNLSYCTLNIEGII